MTNILTKITPLKIELNLIKCNCGNYNKLEVLKQDKHKLLLFCNTCDNKLVINYDNTYGVIHHENLLYTKIKGDLINDS